MQTVAGGEAMNGAGRYDLDLALQHPDMLVEDTMGRPVKSNLGTGGEIDFDNSDRRSGSRRRDLAPDVAAGRIPPDRLIGSPQERRRRLACEQRRQADAEP